MDKENTLGLTAAALALLASGESVAVSVASAVDELLADSVVAVVEPLEVGFLARSFLLAEETEFCRIRFDKKN